MAKVAPKKSPTKSEVIASIAEKTGLNRKQVAEVLEAFTQEIYSAIGKKGPGVFTVPGVCKVTVRTRPATKARKNVPNPFKPGEVRDIAAQPAKNTVRISALKALKGVVPPVAK